MKLSTLFDKILLKFILVGMINTFVSFIIMFILYNHAGIGYWISSATAYVIGTILSFFLNKYFTFNVKKWNIFIVITFILTISTSYFISFSLSRYFINYLIINKSPIFRDNISMLVGMCLFTGINYLGQRFIVFKNKKEI